ncbi:MAG: CHAT domain-containing protein, partial [Anaerolineales bacterium]|nr:CHAT domain-containing protein [Anaerolineales bacterium]
VAETSLGSRLMAAGAQLVVAMGYSVTVTAAEKLMSELYRQLLAGQPPAQAIRQGRLALYNDRKRQAAYDQQIELEDWLLPVVYQNRPVALPITPFASAEAESAYLERQAARYQPPEPTYGFVGRDLDILTIERRVLAAAASNILLVRGLGGAGKSSLLRHLMGWWQRTGLVEQVAYFGYDERAWHLEQILDGLGRKLYGEDGYDRELGPLSATARQQKLVDRLRAERHLLVLDNLESVTGAALAIRHTLDEAARGRLAAFVRALQGGRSLLLLGSRGGEGWLLAGLAGGEGLVYELPGLDPQAAADLAERILQRAGAAGVRSDPAQGDDFRDLMRLLDGHPLAMEVVLPNLKQQSPAGVLAALREGAAGVDPAEVIFRCVEYSHGNLDPEAQALLAGLAPFVGVVNTSWLPLYTEQLQQEAALAGLPFSRWAEVVQALLDWGLASQHEVGGGYLRLQPVLPYFLRRKLAGDSVSEAAAGPRQAALSGPSAATMTAWAALWASLSSRRSRGSGSWGRRSLAWSMRTWARRCAWPSPAGRVSTTSSSRSTYSWTSARSMGGASPCSSPSWPPARGIRRRWPATLGSISSPPATGWAAACWKRSSTRPRPRSTRTS